MTESPSIADLPEGERSRAPSPVPAVIGVGFLAQMTQIVLIRELWTFFSGLEIVLGLTLGIWMALAAVGALVGGRALGKRHPAACLLGLLAVLGLVPPAVMAVLRHAPGFLGLVSGQEPGLDLVLALTALVLALPAAGIGAAFPLGARLFEEHSEGPGRGAGSAYLFEAVGSALGGVLFTFVLVHFLTPFHILILGALGACLGTLWTLRRRPGLRFAGGGLGLLLLGLLLAAGPLDAATEKARWRSFNDRYTLVRTLDSKYGRIAVLRYREQHSFFVSGHLVFSLPDRKGSAEVAHLVLVQHPKPRKVLLLGGGLAGTAREILRHPVEHLDMVELDGRLVQTGLAYLPPGEKRLLDSGRITVHRGDGRLFLKRSPPGTYDLVLVHLPDPATAALNRFYTREFFAEAARALRRGGVCAFTLSSEANYMGDELRARNGTLYHTFAHVFDRVRVVPGGPLVFLGSREVGRLSLDPAVLAQRFVARGLDEQGPDGEALGWFTRHHYDLRLPREDVMDLNRTLRSWPCDAVASGKEGRGTRPLPSFLTGGPSSPPPWDAEIPDALRVLNSDERPGASLATLLLWNRMMGHGALTGLLHWLSERSPWLAVIPVLVLLLPVAGLRLAGRRDRARKTALGLVVAAVGFVELVFELALLLSFQNYYGYVYREMGILFAVFMGGLALGTAASSRFWADRPRPALVAGILLACLAGCLVLPPVLTALGTLQSPGLVFFLFSVLTLLAGLPVGLLFPLAAVSYGGEGKKAAPALYAWDLAGGIAGALLTGALLIPVLGVADTLQIVALLAVAGAGVALLLGGRSLRTE
jgi:spermidine synthase